MRAELATTAPVAKGVPGCHLQGKRLPALHLPKLPGMLARQLVHQAAGHRNRAAAGRMLMSSTKGVNLGIQPAHAPAGALSRQ